MVAPLKKPQTTKMKLFDFFLSLLFSVCGFLGAFALSYSMIVDTIIQRFDGSLSVYFERNPFAGPALFSTSLFVLAFFALGVLAFVACVKICKGKLEL